MKKVFTAVILFCLMMSVNVFAAEQSETPEIKTPYKVAIIPYINSTEEDKGYIKETIDNKYTEHYTGKEFQTVSLVDVQKALNAAGYEASNMELADKDILAVVAKETNADYVIAMEISQLITTRHMSFFQSKVVTKAKLRYKFYNASQDKVSSFQTTGTFENKTVIGDVGYKEPITKSLNQAMEAANEKIMSSL